MEICWSIKIVYVPTMVFNNAVTATSKHIRHWSICSLSASSLQFFKIHNLGSKSIDFVLAFPKADLEEYIWMQLPIGFQINGQTEVDSDRHYVPKLNNNVYGLKKEATTGVRSWISLLLTETSNPLALTLVYTLSRELSSLPMFITE